MFQDWPGRITENKVPTTVVYDVQNPGLGPTGWGFLADTESERPGRRLEEWFKTELDKPAAEKGRIKPADELYRDFLSMVYDRLRAFFTPQQLNGRAWNDARVEFVFSVPATWDTAVVDRFKAIARAAGFGAQHAHSVTASLTEPQAVAGFTVAEEAMFENGESVLVIDIGGGTVDLCLVNIDDKSGGIVSVTELKPVMGDEVGATYIDDAFQQIATSRLYAIQHELGRPVSDVAWQMMRSATFQSNKHELGKTKFFGSDIFKIRVPDLHTPLTNPSLGVDQGEMVFQW